MLLMFRDNVVNTLRGCNMPGLVVAVHQNTDRIEIVVLKQRSCGEFTDTAGGPLNHAFHVPASQRLLFVTGMILAIEYRHMLQDKRINTLQTRNIERIQLGVRAPLVMGIDAAL